MSKFEHLNTCAVVDAALFLNNRRIAATYVYEVRGALVNYLEPPADDSIEVVGIKDGTVGQAIWKSTWLERELTSFDPNKYEEFECGIRFNFRSEGFSQSSTLSVRIFVTERKCNIFGETFLLCEGESIGECAYEFLEKKYDPKYVKPMIGFV